MYIYIYMYTYTYLLSNKFSNKGGGLSSLGKIHTVKFVKIHT